MFISCYALVDSQLSGTGDLLSRCECWRYRGERIRSERSHVSVGIIVAALFSSRYAFVCLYYYVGSYKRNLLVYLVIPRLDLSTKTAYECSFLTLVASITALTQPDKPKNAFSLGAVCLPAPNPLSSVRDEVRGA
jgi:hypothetical protein